MPLARFYLLLLVVMLLFASSALAQSSPASSSTSPSPAYYLLKALISLGLVVALIYAIYFGLRRLSYSSMQRASDEQLQVLHSRHLGGGRWMYAVRVADRVLIVGGGSEGLRTLAEMPAEEYQQYLPDATATGGAASVEDR